MCNTNKLKYLAAVSALSLSSYTLAQTGNPSIDTPMSLTVSNAFTVEEGDVLDFGVIRASQTLDGTSTMTTGAGVRILTNGAAPEGILPTGTLATGDSSNLTVITAGSPGTYNISGAIPNTALQVLSEPTATLDDASVAGATNGQFSLTINYNDMRVTNGDLYTNGASNLITDGTGNATLTVGGKLLIDVASPRVDAETYTGAYTITLSY